MGKSSYVSTKTKNNNAIEIETNYNICNYNKTIKQQQCVTYQINTHIVLFSIPSIQRQTNTAINIVDARAEKKYSVVQQRVVDIAERLKANTKANKPH